MESIILAMSLFVLSSGFLLDGRTQPTPTDDPSRQIDMVMDVVMNERIARRKQDSIIAQLQKELLTTQQEITANYHSLNNNSNDNKRFIKLENKTNSLQNELNAIKINYSMLGQENSELKQNYSILLQRSLQQEASYTDLKNDFDALEQEVLSLRQLKTISELQSVYEVWNETKHLQTEIQKTNNLLNSVVNDGNARKQDFLALYEKADKTERDLKTRGALGQTLAFAPKQIMKYTKSRCLRRGLFFFSSIWSNGDDFKCLMPQCHTGFLYCPQGKKQYVALTASPVENTYDGGAIILFNGIKLMNGINSTASLKQHGFFTCEKNGLYLISVYITTNSNHGQFNVYINDLFVGDSFGSRNDFYETMTYISIQRMKVNDKLVIKGYHTYVYNDMESALSILQIL